MNTLAHYAGVVCFAAALGLAVGAAAPMPGGKALLIAVLAIGGVILSAIGRES